MSPQKGHSILSQACGISRDSPISSWESYTVGWISVGIISGVSSANIHTGVSNLCQNDVYHVTPAMPAGHWLLLEQCPVADKGGGRAPLLEHRPQLTS